MPILFTDGKVCRSLSGVIIEQTETSATIEFKIFLSSTLPHANSLSKDFPSGFCKEPSLASAARALVHPSKLPFANRLHPSSSASGGVMRGFFSAVNLCLKLVRPREGRRRPEALLARQIRGQRVQPKEGVPHLLCCDFSSQTQVSK